MNAQQQIVELQKQIADLKLGSGAPESLQRHLQSLQNELSNLARQQRVQPRRRSRIAIVQPTPPPQAPLTADEQAIWQRFTHFHAALLQYSGSWRLQRQEWLQQADIAADLTGAPVPAPEPIPEGFPTTPPIWLWNAASQTWNPLPVAGGPYGWNAALQQWVLLSGGEPGTQFPVYPPIWMWNATTQAWVPLPNSGGPYGWSANLQQWVLV